MSQINDFINRLKRCPRGTAGWRDYEDLCIEVLCYLFVPPLKTPKVQSRTYSGIERRDAIFPNRNFNQTNNWGGMLAKLGAHMIIFEFKNYDRTSVGKDEVVQIHSYMRKDMGRLSLIISNKRANKSAHIKRNAIYSSDGDLILLLTTQNLIEMLHIMERGEDPSDWIMDEIETLISQPDA